MSGDFKTIDSESIFKGVIVDLSIDTIESPSGRIMKREVIKHMDAVGIVAINANNQIVLVRQYRHAVGKNLLEIPAGLLDLDGETPESCAKRELQEETGYVAESVERISEFYTSVGFANEKVYLYYTDSIVPGEHAREADEEGMRVEEIDLQEAVAMSKRGEIEDSKTLIALLLASQRYENLGANQ